MSPTAVILAVATALFVALARREFQEWARNVPLWWRAGRALAEPAGLVVVTLALCELVNWLAGRVAP